MLSPVRRVSHKDGWWAHIDDNRLVLRLHRGRCQATKEKNMFGYGIIGTLIVIALIVFIIRRV
jgi:hypothetical protein